MRILMAHQDARVRGRLRRAARSLRSNDVEVTASAEEACRRIRAWHPDLVVMSTTMAERYRGLSDGGQRGDGCSPPEAPSPGSPPSQWPDPAWKRPGATLELATLLAALDELPQTAQPSSGEPADERSDESIRRAELTVVERDILVAVAGGATTTQLADQFGVLESVIDAHVGDVVTKLHRLEDAP